MGSEKKMNDGTRFEQSEKPILCANGCGFFGAAATLNLCSKCYRDHHLKETKTASAKASAGKSMNFVSPPPSPKPNPKPEVENLEEKATAAVAGDEKVVEGPSSAEEVVAEKPKAVAAKRCGSCNRKVKLLGFKCRCGIIFCGSHRYPEEHGCWFDFKSVGRDAIAKANPLVKADKIERF
ncbi:hypothetical protein Dimus_034949 [Dionaea muscipula]